MKKIQFALLIILGIGAGASVMLFYLTFTRKMQNSLQAPTPSPHQLDAFKIYGLINDYRASKGLSKLLYDPDMCPYAEKRLQQIHTDWSHDGYKNEVLKTYCKQCTWSGENLGRDSLTENDVYAEWLASPEHLENIVKPEYKLTCIASDVYNGTTFVVQEFASNF